MNKKDEIRSLTWKYFWKRKRKEVCDFLNEYWMCIMPIVLFLLFFIALINPEFGKTCLIIVCITFIIIIVWLTCYLFYMSIRVIIEWLCLNWRLSTEDAIREINRRKNKI